MNYIVYNKIEVIGIEQLPVFFPLFKDWTNKNRHRIATKQASLLTLKFYQWEQVQKDHWKYSDVENDAFLIISNGANEIKEELSDFFDEILNNLYPGKEAAVLNRFVERFCNKYIGYKKTVAAYKPLMKEYKRRVKQYGCRFALWKLRLASVLGVIPPVGKSALLVLCRIRGVLAGR